MQAMQSASWLGLPEYIFDNENLENEDLVAWITMGFHHVPMAEDWPVMPAKVDEIILKPRNFFDRNPAINCQINRKHLGFDLEDARSRHAINGW